MLRPGIEIIRIQRAESTNNYAAEMLNKGIVTEGTAIMACDQYGGRGQRGNSWHMVANEDLAISFVFYPRFIDVGAFVFNKAITLAVCDTVRFFTGPQVKVKWPNDILYQGNKVGGILIELAWQADKVKHAIVGIGLNLAIGHYDVTQRMTSIGDRYDKVLREEVVSKLCECLGFWYHHFQVMAYDEIRSTYRERLFKKGEQVLLTASSTQVIGRLESVDDAGSLVLLTEKGLIECTHGPYRLLLDQPL